MILNFNHKLIFHSLSLCSLVILLITQNVNSWILVLAIGLISANIYHFVNMFINYEERTEVSRFQEKMKSAFQRNFSKNTSYFEEENKYWSSGYFSRSDKAEELKNIKLSDIKKDRRNKFEEYDSCLKQEGITTKKIRNFFEVPEKEDENNIKYLEELVNSVFATGDSFKNTRVTSLQIKEALLTIETYINGKISNNYDKMVNDFNDVNKFLQRCFSLTLAFNESVSQTSVNQTQLMEIIELIQKKEVIPQAYTSSFSPFQIKKELAAVRKSLNNLPNFSMPINILKLTLFMKYLQQQFKGQNVVFSRFEREERIEGNCHLLKCQDNGKVYYNRYSKIKSRCTATPILVLIMFNFSQFSKTNRPLMKQLRPVFNL